MADVFDRIGTLGSAEFRLAGWLPFEEAYQRRYIPVEPQSVRVPGDPAATPPQHNVAQWHIDDWSGGEGDRRWTSDAHRYYESDGLAPATDGSGLIVGYPVATTKIGAASFTDGRHVFTIAGSLYSGDIGNDLAKWDGSAWVADENLGTHTVTSIVSSADGAYWFNGGDDNKVRRYDVAGNTSTDWETGYTYDPVVVSFSGQVFALDGNDLYRLSQSAAASQTLVADLDGAYSTFGRPAGTLENRMAVSDKGPIWLATFPDGTVQIWEYNVPMDTAYAVGTLPAASVPYSIAFTAGTYFATFRQSAGHTVDGDAYLYYQRPGLVGVAGPLRSTASSTGSEIPVIAGVHGDRILMVYTGNLWAYDLSSGGISQVAGGVSSGDTSDAYSATIYGDAVFVANCDDGTDTQTVQRIDLAAYDTTAGTLDTGRFDFGYYGLPKTLTRLTVTLDSPLVSGQKVQLAYSVDGAAFVDVGADTDMAAGETRHMWTVSDSTHGTVRGQDFELRIKVTATASASPKVVGVTAEAIGSDDRIEWLLRPDVGWSNVNTPDVTLAALVALKKDAAVVKFSDPWLVAATDSADTFDVVVLEAYLPPTDGGEAAGTLRLGLVGTLDSVANADGVT